MILAEELDARRVVLRGENGELHTLYRNSSTLHKDETYTRLIEEGAVVEENLSLQRWLADNNLDGVSSLRIIDAAFPEGMQFFRAFGGLAALLRYEIDPDVLYTQMDDDGVSKGNIDAPDAPTATADTKTRSTGRAPKITNESVTRQSTTLTKVCESIALESFDFGEYELAPIDYTVYY